MDSYPADTLVHYLTIPDCHGPALQAERVSIEDAHMYLWGGESDDMRFDITQWALDECLLSKGQGREDFKALLQPTYSPSSGQEMSFSDTERCLILQSDGCTKAYPFQTMLSHEVINEVADGEPVMIAYCVLADLAEVYSRTYCGQDLTFAVSGYTYADPGFCDGVDEQCIGIRAFILWDRETESLWWPLIDEGVSGLMRDTHLINHTSSEWEVITWAEVLSKYPDALVLDSGQGMETPQDWPRLLESDLDCN